MASTIEHCISSHNTSPFQRKSFLKINIVPKLVPRWKKHRLIQSEDGSPYQNISFAVLDLQCQEPLQFFCPMLTSITHAYSFHLVTNDSLALQ